MSPRRTRVVVIGAGFAGVLTARRLAAERQTFEVTLISPEDHFLFTPRLIDALSIPNGQPLPNTCTAELSVIAIRDGITFIQGLATGINRTTRVVTVQTITETTEQIPYDIAIVASGATTNYYGIPGAEAHGLQLKTLKDVQSIQAAIQRQIEAAAKATTDDERRRALAIVVVGGGLSGVESVSILKTFVLNELTRQHPALIPFLSCAMIQAGPQILNGFHHQLITKVERELKRQGIAIRTSSPVAEVTEHFVRTTTDEIIPTGVLLWCAGIKPNIIPMTPEAGRDAQGCLLVDSALRVDDHIASAGDAIAFRHKNVGIPKNAQTALRMALHLSRTLRRTSVLKHSRPFAYTSLGTIVFLSKTSFLEIFGICIQSRFITWLRDAFYRARFIEAVGQIEG